MLRTITARVTGEFVSLSSKNAGIEGEGNAASVRLSFDESWDGCAKRIIWRDARGESPVAVLLGEDYGLSEREFELPIPAEPLKYPGWCEMSVEGYLESDPNRIMKTAAAKLEVKPNRAAYSPAEPTPSQAQQLQNQINRYNHHMTDSILCEEGKHGIRFFYNKLWVNQHGEWIDVGIEGGAGGTGVVSPGNVSAVNLAADTEGNVRVTYTDPDDELWFSTALRRKKASPPISINDGELVFDNREKNRYRDEPFVDSGLETGDRYYYQFFPYSEQSSINSSVDNLFDIETNPYKVYGVRIDLSNSDPVTSVTYTDDAVGLSGGSALWDETEIYKNIRPCVFKDGQVVYYLNKNNYTLKEDGTAATLNDASVGEVMIEIPKLGLSIENDGGYLNIKLTANPRDKRFRYLSHTRETEGDRDRLYIGAYFSTKVNDVFHSLSGQTFFRGAMSTVRTAVSAKGEGYDLVSFYPLTLLQCLYLLRFKSLNSQSAIGNGRSYNTTDAKTGGLNTNGFFYGSTSANANVKGFGIEDLWGNANWRIDGAVVNENMELLTAFKDFNNTGEGYTNRGAINTGELEGFISKVHGTNELGLIAAEASGTSGTYFCDKGTYKAGFMAAYGGTKSMASADLGIFHISFSVAETTTSTAYRLMYL